jgi:hypothetical protein
MTQAPECEHAFCSGCINQWLAHQPVCPIDRTCIQPKELKPVPRILKNLLSKLRLRCDHAAHGCSSIVRLETLASHVHDCEFNPKRPVACTAGCSLIVAKDELHTHNCVRELRRLVDVQQSRIDNLTSEVARQRMDLEIYGSELRILKVFILLIWLKLNCYCCVELIFFCLISHMRISISSHIRNHISHLSISCRHSAIPIAVATQWPLPTPRRP